MKQLTHVNPSGRAHMVDVGEKPVTRRDAVARGRVWMRPETLDLIRDNTAAKGDVLGVARVAGIQAAKKTGELIPLCHSLSISGVDVDFSLGLGAAKSRLRSTAAKETGDTAWVDIEARVRVAARTGVEMEALTAVGVAALTIYDMCKAADRSMVISDIRLVSKSGGRSGQYRRPGEPADENERE
ncbi:MAG: cyclic pyranopterin monophosphate synthase MoaC [Nitrospinota bacterium]